MLRKAGGPDATVDAVQEIVANASQVEDETTSSGVKQDEKTDESA